MPLTRDIIRGLPSSQLGSFRSSRYSSSEQAMPLDSLPHAVRPVIVELYATLRELGEILQEEDIQRTRSSLAAFVAGSRLSAAAGPLRGVGAGADTGEHVAAALHDIRGGALSALVLELSAEPPQEAAEWLRALRTLTRDHMKIMRGLVLDLDPVARLEDLEPRPHALSMLVRAMTSFHPIASRGRVTVRVDHDEDAVIAECCVELGAIDRIAYNLLNNALRHTASPVIDAWLLVMGDHLRVAVANTVTPEHREAIAARMSRDGTLLYSSFSTTDSGRGLRIAAELVGNAYGCATTEELVARGYLGSKLIDDAFLGWFHWPLATSAV